MKVNRSTAYAFLAVGYIAQHKDEGIIMSQNISKEYKIPLLYLLKIMQQLVRANILKGKRGPRGGFSLARPLPKITMLDVIEAVDGSMDISLDLEAKDKFSKNTEQAYAKIFAQTKNAFKKVKLSEIV